MLEKLQNSLREFAKQDVTQDEREAIIELMMMTMYSDNFLKLSEDDFINEYVNSLKWESPLSVEYYFGKATAQVRSALEDVQKKDDFLKNINNRIQREEVKLMVLKVCKDLAMTDLDFSPQEKDFLNSISEAFQLSA
ncbi:MAG: hypothetical protein AAF208_14025 [Cyanobacteria bacterium P01_A01_bin.45]